MTKSKRTASLMIALLLALSAVFSGIFFSGLKQVKAAEKNDGEETASEEDKTINMKGMFEKLPAANMQEMFFCARKARLSTKDEIKKVCAALKAKEEARQAGAYAEALALEQILKSRLTDRQMEALKAYEAFLNEYAKDFMEKAGKTFEDYEKNGEEAFMGAKFTLIYLDGDDIPELAVGWNGFEVGSGIFIYTYKDGEVVPVGGPDYSYGCYGEVGYVEKEGILLSGYERHLKGHYDVYRVEGTEVSPLLRIDEYWHWDCEEEPKEGEGYYTYRIDEEEVLEADYMEQYRIYEEYKEKEKRVTYHDCFLMLDGNIRKNLNDAMGQLVYEENGSSLTDSIQWKIMSGNFSYLEDEDWESKQKRASMADVAWRRLDLNGDGIDDLILEEADTVTDDSEEKRIIGIFACEEDTARCIEWDVNDVTAYSFAGSTGELMYTGGHYGGVVSTESYVHYYFNEDWDEIRDYMLVVYRIDSEMDEEYAKKWKEEHPDMAEDGIYYRKITDKGADEEAKILTREELISIYETKTGYTFHSEFF